MKLKRNEYGTLLKVKHCDYDSVPTSASPHPQKHYPARPAQGLERLYADLRKVSLGWGQGCRHPGL